MKVNFFDLKRQYELNKEEIEEKALEVLRSCAYINGPEVKNLEDNISKYLGSKNVITVNSGTDALIIALKSLGIKEGDEVITTPFTFFATGEAIARVGATPVFVDVEKDTYLIDPTKIEEAITAKTKAILPVHLFGKSCDMDAINKIAEKHNLSVLDDACQAIGADYKGEKIGSGKLSDLTAVSFYPTKNLGGVGDGGMITTNSDKLAKICNSLKAHAAGKDGAESKSYLTGNEEVLELNEKSTELYDPYKYFNYLIAYNSRLDSIQAAILNLKLKKLDMYNSRRNEIANMYIDGINNKEIVNPLNSKESKDVWHQFVLTTEDKQGLIDYLTQNEIGCGNFYPTPLHLQKAFDYLNYKENNFPVSEKLSKSTVCLPIYPELKNEEVEYVIDKINGYERTRK